MSSVFLVSAILILCFGALMIGIAVIVPLMEHLSEWSDDFWAAKFNKDK